MAHYRGHCELRLGEVDAAIAAYRECDDRNPNYSLNLVTLAATLGLAGRSDEARDVVGRIRAIAPDYMPSDFARLVERMIYWFDDRPKGRDLVAALERVWAGPPD